MMHDTQQNQTGDNQIKLLQLGKRLKTARESMQLTEKDAAGRLHLSTKFIDMMENGTVDDKLPQTFFRGYLRSYARLLNISEEDVNAVLVQVVEPVSIPQQSANTSKPVMISNTTRNTDRYIRLITYIIPLILLVLVGIWWSSHSRYSVSDVPSQTATAVSLPAETTPVTPAAIPEEAPVSNPAAITTPVEQSTVAAPAPAQNMVPDHATTPVALPVEQAPITPLAPPVLTPPTAETPAATAESTEPKPVKRKVRRRVQPEEGGFDFLND